MIQKVIVEFGLLVRARDITDGEGRRRSIPFAASGLAVGLAVTCNYSAALALPLICLPQIVLFAWLINTI